MARARKIAQPQTTVKQVGDHTMWDSVMIWIKEQAKTAKLSSTDLLTDMALVYEHQQRTAAYKPGTALDVLRKVQKAAKGGN